MTSTHHLSLYHRNHCPYCRKVREVIDTLGLDIRLVEMEEQPVEWERLKLEGGQAMVPCLRIDEEHGTVWMYESEDIIQYLRQTYGRPQ